MNKISIGFIGIGVMGKSMAQNLLNRGCNISVYSRTKEKAAALTAAGAVWKSSVAEIAAAADVVITMVGYPKDVEEIYCGAQGLLAAARPGTYLIDMTTSSPQLAKKIAAAAQQKNLHALDAPVSGGDTGARDAKLSIMVGGTAADFMAMNSIFAALGTTIRHLGPAGAGQYAKMCNQIAIASNMMGVCESMAYAKKVGLDPTAVLDTIAAGAAGSWSLSNLAPRMIRGDYTPGFFVKHFIKDMNIALESAAEVHLELPGLALAKKLYDRLAAEGGAEYGTQALIRLLDQPPKTIEPELN